ncbi:MAG: carbohydrate ABC transporter permease [Bifidobacteriaceae bacterium]|jgi:raffinose/stachyose/melibiose transport system permease protein|nr:carbohydrate ABC transporter permease [Bifidobacteriaceae bacterium]
MTSRRIESFVGHGALILGALIALYPFVSIVRHALGPAAGSNAAGPFTLENFTRAWVGGGFSHSLVSSAIVAVGVVVVTGAIASLAGYAMAMLDVPWRGAIMGVLLIGLVLPAEARIVPLYDMFEGWGLLNTYWAIILPQIASSFSLSTMWMTTYYSALPKELTESAAVDGANSWKAFTRIVFPLGSSALATLSCLIFLYTWNEFLLALVLLPQNPAVQTAPLSLSFFAGAERNTQPEVIAAAAVLVALPVVIAYAFLQRRFIQGLTEGAVKG